MRVSSLRLEVSARPGCGRVPRHRVPGAGILSDCVGERWVHSNARPECISRPQ